MDFDPQLFPHTHKYVSALPDGLLSYPECQIKADVFRDVVKEFPTLVGNPNIPITVRDHLGSDIRDTWQSEVIANTITLVIRDLNFATDQEHLDWFRGYIGGVFDKPLYRLIMHVLSTTLAVMGATGRWSSFHRGSSLVITEPVKRVGDRLRTKGKLSYPSNLFGGLLLGQLCATYLAALDANRAEKPEVSIEQSNEVEAVFIASWQA